MTPNKHTLLTTISLPPCSDVKLIDALGGMNPKQPCPRTVSMNQQTWDGCLSGASKSVGNESCVAMGLRIQVNPLLLDGQYAVFDNKGELMYAGWVDGRSESR